MPKRKMDEEEEPQSTRIRMPPMRQYLRAANDKQEDIVHERSRISPQAGSDKAVAYLGPLSLQTVNSDANASKPSGIISARRRYPRAHFKAGHMINACFGGDGNNSNNLTILTGSANTSMTIYDNRVKDALEKLRHLFEAFHEAKIDVNRIGECRLRLEVEVSGYKWGTAVPDKYIDQKVYISAEFKNVPEDRSDDIRDEDGKDNHLDAIEALQDEITNLVAQAGGTVDNRKKGSYS